MAKLAHQKLSCSLVAEMQPISLAPLPVIAVSTDTLLCPLSAAHHLVTVLPAVQEIIGVDIALYEITPETGAGGYGAVDKNGCDPYSGPAEHEVVTNLFLITPQKSVAAVLGVDHPGFSGFRYEIHHAPKLGT